MGRKDEQKEKQGSRGHNRIEGFVFGIRLEGTEEVVTEGIKAFTQAMARGGVALPAIQVAKPALLGTKLSDKAVVEVQDHEDTHGTERDEEQATEEVECEAEEPTSNVSGPKRTYNYRPPKFLDSLDLTQATKPIADFMAEKGNPTETNDRYIVVAAWLKEHMQIEEFTIDHVYTVFSSLGWKGQIPVNHSQPLRDLKAKRHFLTKEKGAGYKLNWQGIQYVANMGAGK